MSECVLEEKSAGVIAPELWICAPSRALMTSETVPRVDHARIDAAEAALRALGWRVKEAANVRSLEKSYAGGDAERARGFEEAMCAQGADLVLGLRGGSGAARTLEFINWDKVARSQAVFMGLSDLTALNLALYTKCGKPSWQGPVASAFAAIDARELDCFERAMSRPDFEETVSVNGADFSGSGTLWGGNLSVLTSLIGTPYFPQIEDGILYLEDINEPAWRISRMLSQLHLSGVLARQRLVIAGDFAGADRGAFGYTLADAFSVCEAPVVFGLPFGHIRGTMSMPFGVSAQIRVRDQQMTIRADGCPVPTEHPGAEQANGPLWWM